MDNLPKQKVGIVSCSGEELPAAVEARTRRALESAQKYSLVANSVKSSIEIEPEIIVHPGVSMPASVAPRP